MVKNEEYMSLLNSMIACVSYGDYYSIKELSNLKLENMSNQEKKLNKEIKRLKTDFIKNMQNRELNNFSKDQLLILLNLYSSYVTEKICTSSNLNSLQFDLLSIQEFVKKLK